MAVRRLDQFDQNSDRQTQTQPLSKGGHKNVSLSIVPLMKFVSENFPTQMMKQSLILTLRVRSYHPFSRLATIVIESIFVDFQIH